ncbi:regulatory iron-sulfur-containing complex subunit RicT [uncultured Bacteroides sp.]|jgi:cell fate regulator YaaT (PSP1 superfamily)|uniref:PSP1 domain-containing protein n=1 Tax=uncultured Bacteroides sp. TaxID=162156 RepID=UPI00280BDBB7|nr:regulatory iron-sulfur-containing complex subunit RicT [uncultured Bacteroides sp.]
MSKFILKNGSGPLCCKGCGRQDNKLNTYDWLADIPGNSEEQEMVEVQFKNTRKGYFKNSNHLKLEKGDIVAVEASPGHDIGTVTLTGRLVPLQMRKANLKPDIEIKRVYRKAKPVDLEKYEEAKKREHDTMIRSRQIAADLGLQMKIGDVEYQGDGNKAIFYYIADERVDFRQLIKVLAEAFRVRIEMKQIGARQEAGRIGGIGPCGRELCCATWMTNFVSVSTSAARYQDISLNPQKLAGQCAKLKCCLNYEVDAYVECQKRLPSKEITLETQDATYYYFKADILKGTITYSTDKSFLANEATITARRAFEIINMNKHGEKPEKLQDNGSHETGRSKDLLEQESLTRFDKSKNAKNRKKKKADAPNESRQGAQPAQPETQTEEANGTTKRNEGRQNESRKKERNNRNNGGNQENNGNRQRQEKQEKPQKAQQQPAPQKNLPLPITAENNMQNPQDNRRDDKNNNRRRERNNRHRTKRHNDNETGNGNPDPTPQA